jgi:hypothetical protein
LQLPYISKDFTVDTSVVAILSTPIQVGEAGSQID